MRVIGGGGGGLYYAAKSKPFDGTVIRNRVMIKQKETADGWRGGVQPI